MNNDTKRNEALIEKSKSDATKTLEKIKFHLTGHWNTREVMLNGKILRPRKSQALFNHSPDGFAWGYLGSGPAQLALAILIELDVNPTQVMMFYQRFKHNVIAQLPQADFDFQLVYDPQKFVDEAATIKANAEASR